MKPKDSLKTVFASILICLGIFRIALLAQRQSEPISNSYEGMAFIPAATTEMGINISDVGRFQKFFGAEGMELFDPAIPKHGVSVATFYLDRNLVTNSEFKAFLKANPPFNRDQIPSELHNGNYLRHWEHAEPPSVLTNTQSLI